MSGEAGKNRTKTVFSLLLGVDFRPPRSMLAGGLFGGNSSSGRAGICNADRQGRQEHPFWWRMANRGRLPCGTIFDGTQASVTALLAFGGNLHEQFYLDWTKPIATFLSGKQTTEPAPQSHRLPSNHISPNLYLLYPVGTDRSCCRRIHRWRSAFHSPRPTS